MLLFKIKFVKNIQMDTIFLVILMQSISVNYVLDFLKDKKLINK